MNLKGNMWTTVLAAAMMIVGAALLVLGTLPMENKIENNTLTVKFVIGKKVMDISGAEFLPVPDDVNDHLIRTNGTSVGKKKSGNFKNTRTKNKYIFYLTGKGDRVCFELDVKKYLVDDIN